ncbi:putative tellurite resistance protein [Klebsiella pneumoniae subsp. ozaenae]|uniref:Putative tellurite resistance protein n=1 Tax=Klebsiella pneumoniae subsp. ozaenae TaxID=574 RepID=A0A378BI48_KLEPO|nr:putative tellurite resistance protein [Klebsiella pneumoniae subsp. ozaenae]
MQRIIIPTHYVHTRSTPLWTKETAPASYLAPPSGCRHPAGRLPSSLR